MRIDAGDAINRVRAGKKKGHGFLRDLQDGDYLLFRFRSTIGVIRFNFSVRNGKRWSPYAFITLVSFSSCPDSLARTAEGGMVKRVTPEAQELVLDRVSESKGL